jgi:hypothetical protein
MSYTYVYVAILQNAEGQWEKCGWVGNATTRASDEAQRLNDHDFITKYVRGGKWHEMYKEESFLSTEGIKQLLPLAAAAELPGTPLTARKPMK